MGQDGLEVEKISHIDRMIYLEKSMAKSEVKDQLILLA
jgi:hypothetical protein